MGIKLYPYQLEVFVSGESVYNEDTGEWEVSESKWTVWSKCRDEVAGSGAKINTEDGEVYEYGWMVYCPKNTPKIDKGTKVRVTDSEGNLRAEKSVIRFSKDQLHCRIWL